MATHYIGCDVHATMSELAVERNTKIVKRLRILTTIPSFVEVLTNIPRPRVLIIEEGPMADWLYRNLKPYVNDLIVSDPRRNRLIARDGDKDDRIDAGQLAALGRGGFVRRVYHSDSEDRMVLKQWVSLYHDRVRSAVRQANKIRARGRMYGVAIPGRVLRKPGRRGTWIGEQMAAGNGALVAQVQFLWMGYDVNRRQVHEARKRLLAYSRRYPIIGLWCELPGVALIRAVTMLAYLDTPWRFSSRQKLCKYAGVGLERFASGTDRHGRPNPAHVGLPFHVNRRLKGTVMGAAISAIQQGKNVFAEIHGRMVRHGVTASNARHTVARKLLQVMCGMWKNNSRFDERLVCGG